MRYWRNGVEMEGGIPLEDLEADDVEITVELDEDGVVLDSGWPTKEVRKHVADVRGSIIEMRWGCRKTLTSIREEANVGREMVYPYKRPDIPLEDFMRLAEVCGYKVGVFREGEDWIEICEVRK